MEGVRASFVRQTRAKDASVKSSGHVLLMLFDSVAASLAPKPLSPLSMFLACAHTLTHATPDSLPPAQRDSLLLLMDACLPLCPAPAVLRCLDALEITLIRLSPLSPAAPHSMSLLYRVADESHWDNAATRARLLVLCDLAILSSDVPLRRAAASAAAVAAQRCSASARRSLGEWALQRLARDDDRGEGVLGLMASALVSIITSQHLDVALVSAARYRRPRLLLVALRCVTVGACHLTSVASAAQLASKLLPLAPLAPTSQARASWAAATGAVAVAWARLGGERRHLLGLATRLAELCGGGDAGVDGHVGDALATVSSLVLQRADGHDSDAELAGLAQVLLAFPRRSAWSVAAIPVVRAMCAAGLRDQRGARVWGPALAVVDAAWYTAASSGATDEQTVCEDVLALLAQALGAEAFATLLPLRLGSETARLHALRALVQGGGASGSPLALFGRFAGQLLALEPRVAQLLPALCVCPPDAVAVWNLHVVPLLLQWLSNEEAAPLRAAAYLSVSRAVATLSQVADQQTGPLQLQNILRLPTPAAAAASLAAVRSSAPRLLPALVAAYGRHRERGALDAVSALASGCPEAVVAPLFRSALAAFLRSQQPPQQGSDDDAAAAVPLAVCGALVASVPPALSAKLAAAVTPGLAAGRKIAYRAVVWLARAPSGGAAAAAAAAERFGSWDSCPVGALRFRLELRRRALTPANASVAVREALLGWRGRGGPKARAEAHALLEECVRVAPRDTLQRQLPAALAITDTTVLASAVDMLGHILRHRELREACDNDDDADDVWVALCGAVLALAPSVARELQSAQLSFWSAAARARLCDDPARATAVMRAVWAWDDAALRALRRPIKALTDRLVLRAGADALLAAAPSDECRALVQAMAKKLRRKRKERERERQKREASREERKQASGRQLDVGVEDLLSDGAALARRGEDGEGDSSGDGGDDDDVPSFELSPTTGRMVVLDPEGDSGDADGSSALDEDDDEGEFVPDEEDMDDDDVPRQQQQQQQGRPPAGRGRRPATKDGGLGGKMYKANKAKGDMKRGKYDPFAYVRLDPKTLNRRRAGRTADQFSSLFDKRSKKGGGRRGAEGAGGAKAKKNKIGKKPAPKKSFAPREK